LEKVKILQGVVDLIDKEARYFEKDGKSFRKENIGSNPDVDKYWTKMIETAVETDDELMQKYFDGKELTHEEIVKGFKKAIVGELLFLCFVVMLKLTLAL
jgi:elongation factor G